jgi:hypothetical protein
LEPRLSMFVVKFEHLVEGSLSNLATQLLSRKNGFLTFAVTVFAFHVLRALSFW